MSDVVIRGARLDSAPKPVSPSGSARERAAREEKERSLAARREREVYERGREAGRDELRDELASVKSSAAAVMTAVAEAVEGTAGELRVRLEADAAALAVAIAAHVLRAEVRASPELAAVMAARVVERLRSGAWTLHVHPDDVACVEEALGSSRTAAGVEISVVADARLTRGGCRAESGGMAVDADLDAQLAVIAEELARGAAGESDGGRNAVDGGGDVDVEGEVDGGGDVDGEGGVD